MCFKTRESKFVHFIQKKIPDAVEKIQQKNNRNNKSLISLYDIVFAFKYIYKCTNIQNKDVVHSKSPICDDPLESTY